MCSLFNHRLNSFQTKDRLNQQASNFEKDIERLVNQIEKERETLQHLVRVANTMSTRQNYTTQTTHIPPYFAFQESLRPEGTSTTKSASTVSTKKPQQLSEEDKILLGKKKEERGP